jgi:hypothetical protein
MSCPNCGCKVTYQYGDSDYYYYERCSYCGCIFCIEDAGDDED